MRRDGKPGSAGRAGYNARVRVVKLDPQDRRSTPEDVAAAGVLEQVGGELGDHDGRLPAVGLAPRRVEEELPDRPARGADLPLLLIFAGVIGGLMAFGLLGIFIGPVVLAVTYTLMGSWMDEETGADAEPVSRAAAETLKQEDALRSPASGDSP